MFDRSVLKANAKAAFKANYWRCVIVALIMAIIIGGGAAEGKNKAEESAGSNSQLAQYDVNHDGSFSYGEVRLLLDDLTAQYGAKAVATVALGLTGIFAAVAAAGSLVTILAVNPLSLGCDYFFLKNSDAPAELGELSRGFTPAWWHNVVTMFLRGLFLALWAMLFVFPVFVKAQSYRLAPYIQAEHPDMRGTEAITLSRRMMRGHKWEAFVFDLSFIGWYILAAITASIVGVLWVAPYKAAADAELYRAIRDDYPG